MKLTKEQSQKREGEITEEELLKTLKKIRKDKLPENDGITKEFYKAFWDDLKIPYLSSVNKAFKVGKLSTSQKQLVIKLIKKKDKGKALFKNWRKVYLLNVEIKLVSKVLVERLKTALHSLYLQIKQHI